ncbi:hypothetical protein GOODEAATRI_018678 [Goodea atripinnis]|uniref:Uncharacterized protein n=1 Tax=Goodea atripinnis TaxID=208336 RepID=A0ABV0MT79_9TELE
MQGNIAKYKSTSHLAYGGNSIMLWRYFMVRAGKLMRVKGKISTFLTEGTGSTLSQIKGPGLEAGLSDYPGIVEGRGCLLSNDWRTLISSVLTSVHLPYLRRVASGL